MFVCFCTCEYVQFVGSRQNKKCVLWYKLEGCIYIDWRICVFNVHLPLELSFFSLIHPILHTNFLNRTIWNLFWYLPAMCMIRMTKSLCFICQAFCWSDIFRFLSRWYGDRFYLSEVVLFKDKSPNWTSFNVYWSYWNTITYINLICTWYRMSDLKNFALMFSIRIVHTYIYKVQGTLYVNSPCYFA